MIPYFLRFVKRLRQFSPLNSMPYLHSAAKSSAISARVQGVTAFLTIFPYIPYAFCLSEPKRQVLFSPMPETLILYISSPAWRTRKSRYISLAPSIFTVSSLIILPLSADLIIRCFIVDLLALRRWFLYNDTTRRATFFLMKKLGYFMQKQQKAPRVSAFPEG